MKLNLTTDQVLTTTRNTLQRTQSVNDVGLAAGDTIRQHALYPVLLPLIMMVWGWQAVFWVNMPDLASSAENIQVQRGAGTSSSGASSFGGGIHITTSRPSTEPFGAVSLAAGSFNTQKATFKAGTGTIFGKWNFEARLSKVISDGYVDRASSNLKSYFLTGGYYGEKQSLRMNVFSGKEVTYQSWYGIPEAALDTNRTFNYYNYTRVKFWLVLSSILYHAIQLIEIINHL